MPLIVSQEGYAVTERKEGKWITYPVESILPVAASPFAIRPPVKLSRIFELVAGEDLMNQFLGGLCHCNCNEIFALSMAPNVNPLIRQWDDEKVEAETLKFGRTLSVRNGKLSFNWSVMVGRYDRRAMKAAAEESRYSRLPAFGKLDVFFCGASSIRVSDKTHKIPDPRVSFLDFLIYLYSYFGDPPTNVFESQSDHEEREEVLEWLRDVFDGRDVPDIE